MNIRKSFWGALACACLIAGATPVLAQGDDPGADSTGKNVLDNRVVRLDLEGVDLYVALTMLFKQAKVDYTLDNSLRGTLVTLHIKQPFKRALESVLRSSGLPITYLFESGVYSVVPQKVEAEPTIEPESPSVPLKERARIVRIQTRNLSGIDIVSMLGGRVINFMSGFTNIMFNPFSGNIGNTGMGGGMGGGGNTGFGGMGQGMGAGGLGGTGQGGIGGGNGGGMFTNGAGSAFGGSGGRGF